jgi:hypothetical protein
MQIGWRVAKRLVVLSGIMVVTAAPSRAVDLTLDVFAGGQPAGSLNASQLGCSDTGATTAHCSAQNLTLGDLLITNLSLNLDTDPSVNGVIAVQNIAFATQQFTMTVTLLTAPVGPSTLTGGSVAGGVTDNDGNGATLSTVAGNALYTALIDGVLHQTLFNDPTTLTVVNPFDSADLTPPGSFGNPIPSLPGPAVASSIGIRYNFNLSGQDAASFTGVFVVEPIPEPGTAALFGIGLGGLALLGRRRW